MEIPEIPWLQKLIVEEDRESATNALGSLFLSATDDERETVFCGWDFDVEWPYPTGARLACTKGERYSPGERIVSSLVLEWLEGLFGTREHLIDLCATYRQCELAGISPSEVFESVAVALPPAEADELRAFLRRSAEDRALTDFWLVERVNEDGEVEIHPDW